MTANLPRTPSQRAHVSPRSAVRGHGRRRRWSVAALFGLCLFAFALMPRIAQAQSPASAGGSGSIGTSGSASGKDEGGGFELPDFVYGGNAVSFISPMQFGIVGYVPRVRLGVQYDYQLYKGQWLYGGAAALLDNGDFRTFKVGCGLSGITGRCDRGTVAGFDIYAGYTYKFYIKQQPWIVPAVRGALGFMWWRYPDIGGSRQQARVRSLAVNLRPGGGVRFFLLRDLAVGFDMNFQIGVYAHKDQDVGQDAEGSAQFQLGVEVLPLLVEYRF